MNTKTTKFLAVLAVFAMAFAAFAVAIPAQDNSATDVADPGEVIDGTLLTEGKKIAVADFGDKNALILSGTGYEIGTTGAELPTGFEGIYLLPGASITIDAADIGTESITTAIIFGAAVKDSTDGNYYHANASKITFVAGQLIWTDYTIMNTSGVIGITSESKYLTQNNITVEFDSTNFGGEESVKNVVIYENGKLKDIDQMYGQQKLYAGVKNATTEVKNKVVVDLKVAIALEARGITDLKGGMEVKNSTDSGNNTLALTSDTNAKFTGAISAMKHKITAIDCNANMTIQINKSATPTVETVTLTAATIAGSFEFTEGDFGTQNITSVTGDLVIGKDVKIVIPNAITVIGSIQLKAGADATFNNTVNIQGDADMIVGKLSIAANAVMNAEQKITMTGDLTVRGTLVLGNAATNADSELLALTGNGSIYGVIKSFDVDDQPTTVKITVTAPADSTSTVLFKAYDRSSIIYVDVEKAGNDDQKARTTIDLSGATSTVYLHGTISTSQTYGQTQNVVVDGDLEIKDGAVITINGGFLINDDCKMTITNGKVEVAGAGVDVVINGDIYVDTNGTFKVVDTAKSVKINGIVENEGTMEIGTKDVTVAKDGKMIIGDTATATKITNISIAAGGLLQIGGKIGSGTLSTITNKGSVVFNEAVLVGDVKIIMNGNESLVSILSATNGKVDANTNAAKITITDDGMTVPSKYTQTYFNKIEISTEAAADAGFSGIGIAQTVTTSSTYLTVASKFTVAGNFGVVGDNATMATMTMNAVGGTDKDKANFAFADGFTVGPKATLNVNYLTPVDYNMFVVGAAGDGNEATLTGYLTVNGVIAGNYYAKITDTVGTEERFSAAKFSVGLSTDVVKYYASIENAVEILEDYTEPISLTILGENLVVKESVTIPSNISLKGNGTFTIGSDLDNTVVMTVENGSSIASGLSIKVLGTLYLENAKDLKTTNVTADVKTTDGTDLCYTNLYTALANAEFGDIIEVTTDKLDIIKSIVVPEGVVLNIPSSVTADVVVKNKVTITVNGVLMTGGITGPFADTVSAEAAVLVVNGIFMTSESTASTVAEKVDAVHTYYKSSGAYYYISDDVGDFVYISSLADAVMSEAKNFFVYGKVIETEDIILTKGMSVTMESEAELFAPSITLSDAKITILNLTTPGELTALIKGADGESSFAVTEFSIGIIEDKYDSTDKVNKLSFDNIGGTIAILSGTVFTGTSINAGADSSLTVADGATLYIPTDSVVTLDESALIIGDVYVAGILYLDSEDVVITGDITVLYDATSTLKGKLYVTENGVTFVSGVITVMDGAEFHLETTITAGVEPTGLGAAATIVGDVTTDYAIIAYPGADMDSMTIGGKAPVSTEFYINDELFMTVFSALNKVAIADVIQIPEYDIPELDKKALEQIKDIKTWGAKEGSKIGDYDELYAEIALATVPVTTSWVNGLALYIDGARVMSDEVELTVGVYVISASVNAGYACDNITITFNGTALPVTKEGTLLTIGLEDKGSILAVSGDVYIPEPEPVTPEEKSEWTITTILLVILVILIAIMAVIVALRLNRS